MGKLYYGDNLHILKTYIKDETVDLIYLDPPFNSKADYNVLFKEVSGEMSASQIRAFTDTWKWNEESVLTFLKIIQDPAIPSTVKNAIESVVKLLGHNDMSAYLVMMTIRLVELKRILKPTGSIYLHCDPTASHYLKVLMDAVFDPWNFRNEIIWKRTGSNNSARRFGPVHQTILFYSKSADYYFSFPTGPYTIGYVNDFYKENDERGKFRISMLTGPGIRHGDSGKEWKGYNPTNAGRHWAISEYLKEKYKKLTGKDISDLTTQEQLDLLDEIGLIYWGRNANVPNYKFYLEDAPGIPYQDIWAYQPGTRGAVYGHPDIGIDEDVKWLTGTDKEMLGYPTQKPVGLLERIIKASSREGDVILDPFCGCGTTIHAAQKNNREWIGIDITHLAINLIKHRLKDAFGIVPEVIGEPEDHGGAIELANQDRFQFQFWALSLIGATPLYDEKKKGADRGIDGIIYNPVKMLKKLYKGYVQVKSGHVKSGDIRDFRGTIERDKVDYGVFLTLEEPTEPMRSEALEAGFFKTEWTHDIPKIQILTIKDIFDGKQPTYPFPSDNYTSAEKEVKSPRKRGSSKKLESFSES